MIEGIIFSNLFITNKEMFINIFTEYYEQNKEYIDKIIQDVLNSIGNYKQVGITNAKKFEKAWKEFSQQVLMNKSLELLVVYRGKQGRANQISYLQEEEQVHSKGQYGYGINTANELLTSQKLQNQAKRVENYLISHSGNLLKFLESKLTKEQKKVLSTEKINEVPKEKRKNIWKDGILWRELFYSSWYYTGQGLGTAYDAYMNHIANKHKDLFSWLRNPNTKKQPNLFKGKNHEVYFEEGQVTGNFPRLLKESLNHTPWFRSGDIVIADPKPPHEVLYNIQLKTTGKHAQSTFNIKLEELRKFLKNFQNQDSGKEKAEILFNNLLTTVSNYSNFDNSMSNDIENTIKDIVLNKAELILKT